MDERGVMQTTACGTGGPACADGGDGWRASAAGDASWATVLGSVPLLLVVHDPRTHRTRALHGALRSALGLPEHIADGEEDPLLQRLHPEDSSRYRACLARVPQAFAPAPAAGLPMAAAAATAGDEVQTFRLRRPDGGWMWLQGRLQPVPAFAGAPGPCWLLMATDITGLRQREAQDRGARLQPPSGLSDTPMAVIEWDRQGVVTRWEGAAERLFGWTASEVIGRPMADLRLVHAEDADQVGEVVRRLLSASAASVVWRNRNHARDRRVLHCVWHNTVQFDGKGAARGVLSLVLDVSEQRRAEQALRASEHRHRLLAQTLLQGIVHQDAQGHIIAMNPAAERILGKSRERFLGSDSRQEEHDTIREDGSTFPGDEHPSMRALASGQAVLGVVMGVWNPQRGERRWIRIDAIPVAACDTGGGAEVYTVFEDITERRRTEQALRDADRQKDLFIATLAHELRNPLAPILTAAASLRRTHPEGPTGQCSAIIERQVGQMARLLDDLLDVSRVAKGRLLLRPQRLALSEVFDSAVEAARPLVDGARQVLTVELPPTPLWLRGDRVRLVQVCANLLTNAAKYTGEGGSIRLRGRRQGDAVELSVRDSGIGLAPEHLTRVFEMFGQVHAEVDRAQGGLGIGLALAKGLVEMHGGSIRACSDGPGRGSEFIVRLPAAEDVAPDAVAGGDGVAGRPGAARGTGSAPAQALPLGDAPGAGRQVLVVDDNQDAAEMLALLLGLQGHTVRTAHDAEAALQQVHERLPEVALLDIGLPGMDGHALCRAIRALPGGAGVRIIAVSGWGQEQDRQRSREAGFDEHLVKPVSPATLEALISLPPRG